MIRLARLLTLWAVVAGCFVLAIIGALLPVMPGIVFFAMGCTLLAYMFPPLRRPLVAMERSLPPKFRNPLRRGRIRAMWALRQCLGGPASRL